VLSFESPCIPAGRFVVKNFNHEGPQRYSLRHTKVIIQIEGITTNNGSIVNLLIFEFKELILSE
jgi:hypothetical protein